MEESTKILYREIEERFVKVIWTHKIQLCQAEIHYKNNKCHNKVLSILSVLVSVAAITNVLKWIPECIMVPILAILSLALTFFTILYKTENLGKAATENEHFAAMMHDLRNRYAGLLSEIKAGLLDNRQISTRRQELEREENLIYLGIVPLTTPKAVDVAGEALKTKRESTTTKKEISNLVSKNLHVDE